MGYFKDGVYHDTRTISVRVELETTTDMDDAAARAVGKRLADLAGTILKSNSNVGEVTHASYVLRKRDR